jgi:hypothetical protein
MPPVVPAHRPVHFQPVLREMKSTSTSPQKVEMKWIWLEKKIVVKKTDKPFSDIGHVVSKQDGPIETTKKT